MKTITKINAQALAIGIQKILLDMYKDHGIAKYPIPHMEDLICSQHQVNRDEAEYVTKRILKTGIIRESDGFFIL